MERGRWDAGNHFFHGATKWSNNVAELTAMIQAMLEIEQAIETPNQVWMFYDSTYASNTLAKATPLVHRDSPNTALVTTGRRLRKATERAGTKLHWTHVKGHVKELTKNELWSVGNDRVDHLAGMGKELKDETENIGRGIYDTRELRRQE